MKKIALVAVCFMMIGLVPSFAQLSKKEKKALMKSMLSKCKQMDPEDLEEMYNEYPTMKGKVTKLEKETEEARAEAQAATDSRSELDNKISDLEKQLDEARSAATASGPVSGGSSSAGSSVDMSGVVYKVQIGAFTNKDLSKYFDNNKNFGGEVDADGTQKYTIGVFKEYWEADTFKKYMREMGVKDAWIVAYKDGKRVSMKEAREG